MFVSIKDYLKKNDYLIRPVEGISMYPLLNEFEDTVKIEPIKEKLKIGDVVLFYRRKNRLVLHRIISISKNESRFYLMGDNNKVGEWKNRKEIVGIMTGYYKNSIYKSCKDKEYLDYSFNLLNNLNNRTFVSYFDRKEYLNAFNFLLELLKLTLDKSRIISEPNEVNYDILFYISEKHMISSIVANEVIKLNFIPTYIKRKYQESYFKSLKRKILFENERRKILTSFDINMISYLPLKGVAIDDLYENGTVRSFADNDVLIEKHDLKKAIKILKDFEFKKIVKGAVHYSFYKKPIFNFEIHTSLFTAKLNKCFNDYFDDYFLFAVKNDDLSFGYHLDYLDQYVYLLAHYKKHYEIGGAGLNSLYDLYLVKRKIRNIQELQMKLEKSNLLEFNSFISTILNSFFDNSSIDIDKKYILYILSSFSYGTSNHRIENVMKEYTKSEYILLRLFPGFEELKDSYQILKKFPVFLPLVYIWRVCSVFCSKNRRNRAFKEYKLIKNFFV